MRLQWVASWSAIVMLVLYGVFWGAVAHGAPPLSPALSAADVAAFVGEYRARILLGMTLAAVTGGLWIVWSAQVTLIMRRIEGGAPLLSLIQLSGGILTTWAIIACPAIWATAAFRPDAPPALVQGLIDLGFITFNVTYMPTSLQAIAVGMAGLMEKRDPVFPPWVCYVAIAAGLANIPATFVTLVKTGPWAWDGAITFPVPGLAFYIWPITMSFYMLRDCKRRNGA